MYMANQGKTQDLTDYGSSVQPWPIFKASVVLSALCRQFADWLTPPTVRVFDTTFAFNRAVSVYACSKLGWPDALYDGPKTCGQLSLAANTRISASNLTMTEKTCRMRSQKGNRSAHSVP
jgi:hypothetical protein